jgi:hypothetical protein
VARCAGWPGSVEAVDVPGPTSGKSYLNCSRSSSVGFWELVLCVHVSKGSVWLEGPRGLLEEGAALTVHETLEELAFDNNDPKGRICQARWSRCIGLGIDI